MKEVFACIGLFCTVAIIGYLIAALWYEFKEWIQRNGLLQIAGSVGTLNLTERRTK